MAEGSHEARDFIIAFLALIWGGLVISFFKFGLEFYWTLTIVGGISIAYFPHELAHKLGASLAGFDLELKLWNWGLFLAIVLPVITLGSIFFAVPLVAKFEKIKLSSGSDYDKFSYYISAAGPLMNILLLILFTVFSTNIYLRSVGLINAAFAFFNLLPHTDGHNIYLSSKSYYALILFVLVFFTIANIYAVTTDVFLVIFVNFSAFLFFILLLFVLIVSLIRVFGFKIFDNKNE